MADRAFRVALAESGPIVAAKAREMMLIKLHDQAVARGMIKLHSYISCPLIL